MKFAQVAKRVTLFLVVNILVVATITIILSIFRVGHYMPGGSLVNLAVFCLVWGFGFAFISLALSRVMARWMMGVQVIPPETRDPGLQTLVQEVHGLARQANLPRMPQVGIYQSDEVNAFATGPTKSRALVAVSTGLLDRMGQREVSGVLAHEVTHITNGDMVTMTLIQGVINAFVMFLSRVVAFVFSQALRGRDDRDSGGGMVYFLFLMLFQTVFGILGMMVVSWFSRWREFRADAGGARLAGRGNMIDALKGLQRLYNPELAAAEAHRSQSFQSLKISGEPRGLMKLLATHPPLAERIARLEHGAF